MAYLSLYRKYRPQTFAEVLGQEHVSKTLANAITEDRVAHAYLLTGPRGTGKTSMARLLAKALNCVKGPTPEPCGECDSCVSIAEGSSLDVIEMDAASHSKVDETRDVLAGVALATAGGRKKVYVIDEVHMLSTPSFNALLKTLEEPPEHVVFILATTEAHKVLQTIISRTQRFDFRRIPADVLEAHLADVSKREGFDIEPDALALVARHAEGSARDALSSLDQLSSVGGRIGTEDAERLFGARNEDALFALYDAIATSDVGAVFEIVNSQLGEGADMRQLALSALDHARSLLLLRTAPDAESLLVELSPEDRTRLGGQADRFSSDALVRAIDLLGKSLIEMRNAPNHRLLLEIALVRAAAPETDPSPTGLLGRIERLERRLAIDSSEAPPVQQQTPAPARAAQAPPPQQAAPAPKARPTAPAPQQTRPATKQQPQAAPTAPAPVPAQISLGHLKDSWPSVIKEVNAESKRIGAFLYSSQPVALDEHGLAVRVQSAFHASSMKDESSRQVLSRAIHATLGVQLVAFRFVEPDAPTQAPEPEAAEEVTDLETLAPKVEDPIELLKKGLAAEVVEEKTE
jgi:DNA polymerase III subunit gamma/tau